MLLPLPSNGSSDMQHVTDEIWGYHEREWGSTYRVRVRENERSRTIEAEEAQQDAWVLSRVAKERHHNLTKQREVIDIWKSTGRMTPCREHISEHHLAVMLWFCKR